jgi:hypothetical protein
MDDALDSDSGECVCSLVTFWFTSRNTVLQRVAIEFLSAYFFVLVVVVDSNIAGL